MTELIMNNRKFGVLSNVHDIPESLRNLYIFAVKEIYILERSRFR